MSDISNRLDYVEPVVTTRATYTYNLAHGILVAQPNVSRELITKVVITIETDSGVEGGFYIDHDAFGYLATKSGERDLRSGLERKWMNREWFAHWEADAMRRYNTYRTGALQPGSTTIGGES